MKQVLTLLGITFLFIGVLWWLFNGYAKPTKPYSQIISESANKASKDLDGAPLCASYKGDLNISQDGQGIFYSNDNREIPAEQVEFIKCPDYIINQLNKQNQEVK